MADQEQAQNEQEQDGQDQGGGQGQGEQEGQSTSVPATALKAAAAAAATGAATYAVRKVMSRDDSAEASQNGKSQAPDKKSDGGEGGSSKVSSIASSAGSSIWEAASGALLPMAEEAAGAAGKYLAERGPDVVRQRIVPRFIEAFNEAS